MCVNEEIKEPEVMVIGPQGEKLGVKKIADALTLANYAGFDLVMINPNQAPPICKIMDYNKFVYENAKKEKENRKKQREANLEMKEYRLSVSIEDNDLQTKVKNAFKYLEKGHRVKGTVRFKGRELAHPHLGEEVLHKFAQALEEIAEIEKPPIRDRRFMTMILAPKKEK